MAEKDDQASTSVSSGDDNPRSMNELEQHTPMQLDQEDDSKQVADPKNASSGWEPFWAFVSSGLFFMLFGAVMLFVAYQTMSSTHSSFTFVLVVIGVAILLYGTGTQGAGEFAGEQGGNRYKAAIAGGAGVLAFAIGIGMVVKQDDIRAAFQVERKYFRFPLHAADDGITNLANYAAIAMINGTPVPTALRGDRIEIYVPYLAGQETGTVIQVSGFLYRREPAPLQKATVEFSDEIVYSEGGRLVIEGGFEFPRWESDEETKISVRETEPIDLAVSDQLEHEKSAGSAPPPSLLFDVQ